MLWLKFKRKDCSPKPLFNARRRRRLECYLTSTELPSRFLSPIILICVICAHEAPKIAQFPVFVKIIHLRSADTAMQFAKSAFIWERHAFLRMWKATGVGRCCTLSFGAALPWYAIVVMRWNILEAIYPKFNRKRLARLFMEFKLMEDGCVEQAVACVRSNKLVSVWRLHEFTVNTHGLACSSIWQDWELSQTRS